MNALVNISAEIMASDQRIETTRKLKEAYKKILNEHINKLLEARFSIMLSVCNQAGIMPSVQDNFLRCIRQRGSVGSQYRPVNNLVQVDYAQGYLTARTGGIWRGLLGEHDKRLLGLESQVISVSLTELADVDKHCDALCRELIVRTVGFFYSCWNQLLNGDMDFLTHYNKTFDIPIFGD